MSELTDTAQVYDQIANEYTAEFFDVAADKPYLDTFIQALPSTGRVLDAGCGPGGFAQYLLARDFEVIGVDISDSMLKIAKQRVPRARFEKYDLRRLSYPDAYFDGILAAYSLIHIPSHDLKGVFDNFHRMLKANGQLMIMVHIGEPDHFEIEPFDTSLSIFTNLFTQERLQGYLDQAGFSGTRIWQVDFANPHAFSAGVIYCLVRVA